MHAYLCASSQNAKFLLEAENPSSCNYDIIAMVTSRVVVLELRNYQSQLQVACLEGIHEHLIGLLWYSVVGNLENAMMMSL